MKTTKSPRNKYEKRRCYKKNVFRNDLKDDTDFAALKTSEHIQCLGAWPDHPW